MSNELTTLSTDRVTLSFPTLITDCIGSHIAKVFEKNVEELTAEINLGIERGAATAKTAGELESMYKRSRKAINAGEEIRKQFTSPLDRAKTLCITQQREYLKKLSDASDKARSILDERARRLKEEEQKAIREAAEENQRRIEAAQKEQARRDAISVAKGGKGGKPVEVETVTPTVAHISMNQVTTMKHRVDEEKIQEAIDNGVRKIPGVYIYCVWKYDITDRSLIPTEYKSFGR